MNTRTMMKVVAAGLTVAVVSLLNTTAASGSIEKMGYNPQTGDLSGVQTVLSGDYTALACSTGCVFAAGSGGVEVGLFNGSDGHLSGVHTVLSGNYTALTSIGDILFATNASGGIEAGMICSNGDLSGVHSVLSGNYTALASHKSGWIYAATPEPATLSLLALGGLAVLRRRRRRR